MTGRKDRRRRAWFLYGVEALVRARPRAPRVYGCPICLRGFDSLAGLTFEDVPPKSVGGRPLVLTCFTCNNRAGQLLDPNIRAGRDWQEVAAGTRETWIKLSQSGHTVTAKATFGEGEIRIAAVPEKSDPQAHRSLFERLGEVAATGSTDWHFQISFSARHNAWRESVGWLRVAYLYAFAALGYNFILRPELDVIREQFRRPDDRVVPEAMKHTGSATAEDGLSFVYTPSELRGVVVRLGVNMFCFPGFVDASTFYERLARYPASGQLLTLSGTHLALPRRPRFEFDYHPESMRFTVPVDDRSPTNQRGV